MAYVYFLSDDCEDKARLGNKGANLVTMTKLGLPIPTGFVLSIDAYAEYKRTGNLPEVEIDQALITLKKRLGRNLGNGLKVSVRSSAPVSMPGMMDTVLNINDISEMKAAVKRVFNSWDNPRAIEYRRLHKIPSNLGTAAIMHKRIKITRAIPTLNPRVKCCPWCCLWTNCVQSRGLTSHAAIVTRAMGKPCVCGAEEIEIDLHSEQIKIGEKIMRKGYEITIDGTNGFVYQGCLSLEEAQAVKELEELMTWWDGYKRLGVRANADTPKMVAMARKFSAEGIGLCRTERQFNKPERLQAIREFILAKTAEGKKLS